MTKSSEYMTTLLLRIQMSIQLYVTAMAKSHARENKNSN